MSLNTLKRIQHLLPILCLYLMPLPKLDAAQVLEQIEIEGKKDIQTHDEEPNQSNIEVENDQAETKDDNEEEVYN